MMNKLCVPVFGMVMLANSVFAQLNLSREKEVQQVIILAFDAFSDGSIQKMELATTADVKILEHGVVWTMDSLRTYFKKARPADFKRVNQFDFFTTEITDQMAFVSYFNRADIHANNKDRTIKWLESAVLVKENNKWKIRMLHSTRIP